MPAGWPGAGSPAMRTVFNREGPPATRAVLHVLRRARFDEIVLSTLPAESQWVADDLQERIGRVTGLPVVHLVADVRGDEGYASAG